MAWHGCRTICTAAQSPNARLSHPPASSESSLSLRSVWSSPSPLTPTGNLYTPNPTTASSVIGGQQGGGATSSEQGGGSGQVALVSSSRGERGAAATQSAATAESRQQHFSPLVRSFRNLLRASASRRNRRGPVDQGQDQDG